MGKYEQSGDEFNLVRNMLILEQFDRIVRLSRGVCNIVPLKGIALLRTLYKDSMDRSVGDIDIMVWPAGQVRLLIARLQDLGYTVQFDYLADDSALFSKKKIALRSKAENCTDIDIHLDFITKKFFSKYCGSFNSDALSRCSLTADGSYLMDDIDNWIFLAQHACFHQFSNYKWLQDLHLLKNRFTAEQFEELLLRSDKYGFHRIIDLTLSLVSKCNPSHANNTLPFDTYPLWKKYSYYIIERRKNIRIASMFWELIFIDNPKSRFAAHLRLAIPSVGELKSIYRTRNSLIVLLYPFHTLFSLLLFSVSYLLFLISPLLISRKLK